MTDFIIWNATKKEEKVKWFFKKKKTVTGYFG